jgi:hypothetical protein
MALGKEVFAKFQPCGTRQRFFLKTLSSVFAECLLVGTRQRRLCRVSDIRHSANASFKLKKHLCRVPAIWHSTKPVNITPVSSSSLSLSQTIPDVLPLRRLPRRAATPPCRAPPPLRAPAAARRRPHVPSPLRALAPTLRHPRAQPPPLAATPPRHDISPPIPPSTPQFTGHPPRRAISINHRRSGHLPANPALAPANLQTPRHLRHPPRLRYTFLIYVYGWSIGNYMRLIICD